MARDGRTVPELARTLAHVASAITFISLAATVNAKHTVDGVVNEIREQIRAIMPSA